MSRKTSIRTKRSRIFNLEMPQQQPTSSGGPATEKQETVKQLGLASPITLPALGIAEDLALEDQNDNSEEREEEDKEDGGEAALPIPQPQRGLKENSARRRRKQ